MYPWPTDFPDSSVATAMLTFLPACASRGAHKNHFLEPVKCLFYWFWQWRPAGRGSYSKPNNNTDPTFLTLTTYQNEILASPIPNMSHTISRAALFASSEYFWMLLSGHIPLSGRLPGTGLPILSPFSRLPWDLHFIQQQPGFFFLTVPAATSVAGVMEKNEKQKKKKNSAREEVREQSSKRKKSIQEEDVCCFQGCRLAQPKLNPLILWGENAQRYESNSQVKGKMKSPPMMAGTNARPCVISPALPLYLHYSTVGSGYLGIWVSGCTWCLLDNSPLYIQSSLA